MRWLGDLGTDVSVGLRIARRSPIFAATAIVVLAVGIGASTAVYSLLREVLLRPLPYPEPDRLLHFFSDSPSGIARLSSAPQFLFWQSEVGATNTFESIGAFQDHAPGLTLMLDGRVESVRALRVSAGYFSVFKAPFTRGRPFTRGQDHGAGPNVVILTDGFWRRYFGRGDVVGESLWLANEPYEIVGILSPAFVAEPAADVLVPLRAAMHAADHTRHLRVIARLDPRVTLAGAQRQIADTTSRFRREHPFALGQYEFFSADTLHAVTVGPIKPTLQLLAAAVALVLIVACANVATLLLSRGRLRSAEVAARAALGASRPRIVRQLLTETMCLALAGAALGVPLAHFALEGLLALGSAGLPPSMVQVVSGLTLDAHLIGIAVGAGLGTGVLCGIIPATTASRVDLSAIFKSGSSPVFTSWRSGGAQSALLIAEVAVALVLLAATAIVLDSLTRLRSLDRGFDATRLVTIEMPLTGTPFIRATQLDLLLRSVENRVQSIAGVASTAAAFVLPTDMGTTAPFVIHDRPLLARGAHHGVVRWELVSPEYFATLRIARLDGRLFADEDRRGAPAVAIVNRALARRFWGGQSVLDERIALGGPDWQTTDDIRHIVGVVADARGHDTRSAEPTVYIPIRQANDALLARQHTVAPLRWLVRSAGDPGLIAPAVATVIEHAAPATAVTLIRSMAELLSEQAARARFAAQLLGAFAIVSVVLAVVGLYGYIANAISARYMELGIRAALGASGADLLRLVASQGAAIIAGGIVVGITVAMLTGAAMEAYVVGTHALTPAQLAAIAVVQLVTASVAILVAARPAYSAGVTLSRMSNRA